MHGKLDKHGDSAPKLDPREIDPRENQTMTQIDIAALVAELRDVGDHAASAPAPQSR